MKILTSQQMREIDRLTVERCGIPYPTLMETAGARVVEAIVGHGGPITKKVISVFCGKGNNGGDGAVVARLLWMRGAPLVCVYLFGRIAETKGEARINFEIISQIYEEERKRANFLPRLSIQEITEEEEAAYISDGADVVIDALLGTGLTRPAEGLYAKAIESINHRRDVATIVSVDIPSGLSSDTGQPIGPRVQADLTVSFTAPKIGNVLAPASESNGKLVIASIGAPNWLIEEGSGYLQIVEEKLIAEWLRASRRPADAHKGSVGDALLIAGSRGKTGAAALSSETILRAGAGLVTVATAHSAQSLLVTQARTEIMTEGLDETPEGAISSEALDRASQLAQKRTVIAIGPGLSSSDESTRYFVREMVEERTAAMVIDADGLNSLAPWPEDLKGSDESPIIITPHPGEMARLTGWTAAEIVAGRIDVAREFATKHYIITVLKGSRTIIASPGGEVYVNPTGNAGMATAGSGDVLTGLVAGLLAQRPSEPLEATIAAVYLHGLAGDLAANKLGMRPLVASDIIANLSEAMLQAGGDAERGQKNTISTI
ncbi:MAG TPA: NAD(P)H-hydrate dehydratase [Blastocatellia bacterium]|jgi:NAD(P)H-hydrate epimerase|nr:NAD(P)H-hydrate dehydratase [Blastocatellia bacterium]